MKSQSLKKSFKFVNSVILAIGLFSCSNNAINTSQLSQSNVKANFKLDNKSFAIKYSSAFNAQAYFLTWSDIRSAIINKSIPDVFYHFTYAQTAEPSRVTSSNYLEIKNRIDSGEWSEEAYLIANPDVKAVIDGGSTQTGYSHWYGYAINSEPSRKTSTAYLEAKSATDLGFSEKAYRLAWSDIDSAVKSGSLASGYAHWNTYAKNSETSRLSDPRYIKIKEALDRGYDEKAYLLAYPDIKSAVTAGTFPSGLKHYIDQGFMENRLELLIYQDAKLALLLDFDETRYRSAFPNVVAKIHNPSGGFASAFQHFSLYGKHERRLQSQAYLNTKAMEFIVNTRTTNIQQKSKLATDSNGNFVVVWESVQDGSQYGVYGQRYNSSGIAQGSEFIVNTRTTNQQRNPSVAMDSTGNFVVTWQSNAQDGAQYGIYGQRFNADGTKPVTNGSEFIVNTYTTGSQNSPAIAMDSTGNFVVTWQSNAQDGDTNGVYGQRFNSSGTMQDSEFRVNSYITGNQAAPSVAMDSTGNFVVTWQSNNQDGSQYGIYGQRFNSSGTMQDLEFRVNSYTMAEQTSPDTSMSSAGNFVVTWQSIGQDGSNNGIYCQAYNADGSKPSVNGNEFRVNTYTTGSQTSPAIAIDSSSNFVVTWQSNGQDGNLEGVYAKKYNSLRAVEKDEFQVNTYTTDIQASPSVIIDGNGNFTFSWQSNTQDGSFSGVYGKRYNS